MRRFLSYVLVVSLCLLNPLKSVADEPPTKHHCLAQPYKDDKGWGTFYKVLGYASIVSGTGVALGILAESDDFDVSGLVAISIATALYSSIFIGIGSSINGPRTRYNLACDKILQNLSAGETTTGLKNRKAQKGVSLVRFSYEF